MIKKICGIFALLLFVISVVKAQNTNLVYSNKLTVSNGLAHNGVTSIHEDSRGFLWFGTYDGINRYDGYEVKTYKNTIDQNILTSNRVRVIDEDKKGNLWLGTDQGITVYNSSQESFNKVYSNETLGERLNGPIVRNFIFNDERDLVICATERSGILLLNSDYSFVGKYIPSGENFDNAILFYEGLKLDESNYIFTTSDGLIVFNIQSKKFQKVLADDINFCNSILKIDDGNLLVTLSSGLVYIKYKLIGNSYSFQIKHKALESRSFNSSLIDSSGKLWLGTLNAGVIQVNNTELFKNNSNVNVELFNDGSEILRISAIVSTKNNNCWVATFNKGVYKFDLNKNPFKTYNTKMQWENAFKTNSVTHIAPLDRNRAYVIASFGGMALFNASTNKFEKIPLNLSKSQIANVSSVFVDSKKNVWIKLSNDRSLYRIKKGQSRLEKIPLKNIATGPLGIRSFTEDKYGNIWIGLNIDVLRISINKKDEIVKVESLNKHSFFESNKLKLARVVYADPLLDFVWVGADADGLFRLKDYNTESIENIKLDRYVKNEKNKLSISSNFVTAILRLPNEELWIGTEGGGICKVLKSDNKPEFVAFTEKNGLSNNVVKSILFDDEYNLWVSTNIGLNKFDIKDASFRIFNDSDGLPFEDFWFSAQRLKNGFMLFSGLDGLCYFNPKKIPNKEKLPDLEFENFKLFNKTILPGDTVGDRVLLRSRLTGLDKIELNHNENVFSLDLTSLHFSNPENHHLKFRLLPINEDWVEVPSSEKTVYYNGLQPGKYNLSVMASNSLKEWTVPKGLEIVISPPFWKTNVAYLLYLLLAALLVFMIFSVILKIQALNHKVEIEKLEIDSVKEVNKAKLRFFSNISHEIKTPLTLISGPIDVLLERFKGNQDVNQKLFLMQRQSKKIQQLIDQVHDFQRADANLLKMNYSEFCFNTFIQNLAMDFDFMAKKEKRNLELIQPNEKIYVSADRDKLEKVFNNLLNNAFKFTKENDTIRVEYKQEGNNLKIIVSDTGKGIDSEDLGHIFERFYQSHKKHSSYTGGSGIGLAFSKRLVDMHYGYINVESELNKGTEFTVCMPIVLNNFDESQLQNEQKLLLEEERFEPKELVRENVNISKIVSDKSFAKARIFFAEDNFDMRNFVTASLSNFFDVKTFENGQVCSEALNEEWPDLILSDVLMPEMNGFELCKRVKTDIKTSHIPVVLLTACTTIDEQIEGINNGADAYIKKPFNMQHLVTRIESLLRNRQQLRERYKIDFPLTLEKREENNKDVAFLEKLYSLMAENLDNQELDLNSFAKELYLNRTHFYQKVKVLTNKTPFELLKAYRLKKAAEFLVQKKISVNEVFVMTGFKSRTHFTKLFKEKYNITPGKYAAETKKKYS